MRTRRVVKKTIAVVAAVQSERNLRAALNAVTALVADVTQGLRNRGLPTDLLRQLLATSDTTIEELERAAPNDDRVRRLRVISLGETSATFLIAGAHTEARDAAVKALLIANALVDAAPEDKERQYDLAVTYLRAGSALFAMDNSVGALEAYAAGRDIFEKLVGSGLGNPGWLHGLAISEAKIGHVFVEKEEKAAAAGAFLASVRSFERLRDFDPSLPRSRRGLSVAYASLGDAMLATETSDSCAHPLPE